jgi:hypothetical protein
MSGLNTSESGTATEKNRKNLPAPRKFTLLNLREQWFISPLDSEAVNGDNQAPDGATDAQWVALLKTFVRLKPEQEVEHWGIMRRCDVLNWLHDLPNVKKPKFFASKREALISVNFGKSSDKPASQAS